MIETTTTFLAYIAFIAFASKRLMNYLHALQQDDYDNGRLFRWMLQYRVFDKRASAGLVLLALASSFTDVQPFIYNAFIFLIFIVTTYLEKDPRKDSKKPLVLTGRAKRIYIPALLLAAGLGYAALLMELPLIWLFPIHMLPALVVFTNITMQPYESYIQKKFYNEARAILQDIKPTIIGITGSYGKTSVKHILGHILNSAAPTLMTPGSVNTLMGITRIIRERLQPNHRFFIVEMGAYGPGSIRNLCRLTPPDLGIISSIGHAHYERFKTLETVAHAKYELAEAALANNGDVVAHERTLRFDNAFEMRAQHLAHFIVCGQDNDPAKPDSEPSYLSDADLHIKSLQQTKKGLKIALSWGSENASLAVPIFGLHHGHNVALAYAAARKLGIDAADVKAALARCPQIPHRLDVKPQQDGSILVDDAYNSNPPGFRAALELMIAMQPEGRKILVTPGIVELGSAHDQVHHALGAYAAEICDIVVVVNPSRIPTFIEGYRTSGKGRELKTFETFAQAQDWLVKEKKSGDLILLENDLPDLYERVPKI